jgi:hypothetical protein
MYFVRGGFLDGRPGWHLARLMSCYEYMISLLYQDKLAEARGRRGVGRPSSSVALEHPKSIAAPTASSRS